MQTDDTDQPLNPGLFDHQPTFKPFISHSFALPLNYKTRCLHNRGLETEAEAPNNNPPNTQSTLNHCLDGPSRCPSETSSNVSDADSPKSLLAPLPQRPDTLAHRAATVLYAILDGLPAGTVESAVERRYESAMTALLRCT